MSSSRRAGSQSGIITNDAHANARIIEVRPYRVQDELARGKVVIVAGYQGVSYKKDVTTLGRGGSDTTAVALAAALDAEACEIYSDLEGVYSADPRLVPAARPLAEISYEEMQELAEAGAKVLNAQAVEFAKEKGIALFARSSLGGAGETIIRRFPPKTPGRVVGIATETGLVLLRASGGAETLTAVLECLDGRRAGGKQLLYREDGGSGSFSLVLSLENLHGFAALRSELQGRFGPTLDLRESVGAVSAIGAGINARYENLRGALRALEAAAIHPLAVSTSSFRISVLLDEGRVAEAARVLHSALLG